jgi:predicted  nucleic acid-binding Zn-ribbon protein
MMDNDSVAMFLPEEPVRKRQSCKPGRRFFCILALLAFLTLIVLFSVVLSMSVTNTNRYESLKIQYDQLRNKNEGKTDYIIDNRINKSELDWNARFGAISNNLRSRVEADKKLRSRMNISFENIANDVEHILSELDNLTLSLLRINTTSDGKIRNLRNVLKAIKGDLRLTRTTFTQINGSLRNDLTQVRKSLSLAVKGLKNGLRRLNDTTTEKTDDLWRYWNQTNTEFQQSLEKMARQNTTFHLIVDRHSDTLYSEVKDVEKKLARLSNKTFIVTKKDKQNLQKELNKTRRILKDAFQNEISRTNASLSKKIESFETQLSSSFANVKTKIHAVQNQLQKNITHLKDKQKNIKDDLSKTKLNLQAVDSRHDTNISALAVKIQYVTSDLNNNLDSEKDKRLQLEKEVRDLRSIVDKLQSKANGILGVNVPLVVFLMSFTLLYI